VSLALNWDYDPPSFSVGDWHDEFGGQQTAAEILATPREAGPNKQAMNDVPEEAGDGQGEQPEKSFPQLNPFFK
jgi:hypothetical protein